MEFFFYSFPDSSWTTTSYPRNVEVVYESTPDSEQKLSYQESTYHELPSMSAEETTYQDTPPQPIYQQKNEYSEDIPTATESSYYANIRGREEEVKNNDDNELMKEIEALEQKLDILQDEIQTYLNE